MDGRPHAAVSTSSVAGMAHPRHSRFPGACLVRLIQALRLVDVTALLADLPDFNAPALGEPCLLSPGMAAAFPAASGSVLPCRCPQSSLLLELAAVSAVGEH